MKAVINEKETPVDSGYPKLMTLTYPNSGSTIVVLFDNHKCGMTVYMKQGEGTCLDKVGDYYKSWDMSKFTPFTGSITISND